MTVSDDSKPNSARRFLAQGAVVVGATGAFASLAYPIARYLQPLRPAAADGALAIEVCADSELAPGQMRLVRAGSIPVIVLRRHDASLIAWNALCTHLGCTVRFRPERDDLLCACHGAVFNASSGVRMSGPALSPLARANVEVRNGRIVVRA